MAEWGWTLCRSGAVAIAYRATDCLLYLTVVYPAGYIRVMVEVHTTPEFDSWLDSLAGDRAQTKVLARIRNMTLGNFGDCKPVGKGVSESRIDFGPGYRIYFIQRGGEVVVLLAGGDKSTQERDIQRAKNIAAAL